ncbi:MAG: hypothetical protein J6X02_02420 [Bacilli bacterium]|nr:hypothetical protein [Bacilli bacterium]
MNVLEPETPVEEKKKVIPRLNANDAVRKIEDINDDLSKIQRDFIETTGDYLFNLSNSWWSSKAVNFGDKLVNRVDQIDRELVYLDESTVNDACSSFNDIAHFRNTRSIYVKAGPFLGVNYNKFKEADDVGRVGMNTKNVENYTNEYVSVLESLKKNVNGIPNTIGFYDVNGSLVKTYQVKLNKINSLVNDSINLVSKEVQTLAEQEVDLTEKGASEATSVLSRKTSV